MLRSKWIIIITLSLLVCLSRVRGQQLNTAGVYGRVTDQQGAAIPNVKVTLIDVTTGITRTAQSDSLGQFQFSQIPVGDYNLVCEKSGFSTVEHRDIPLQVNDNRRVDVTLPVGQVTTKVNVFAPAATINTTNATLKDVVDTQRVNDLPLNGRNLEDLAFLVPGVQSANGPAGGSGDGAKTPIPTRYFSVNGSRQNDTGYTLDGADNEDMLQDVSLPFPFPDAVQEFSVETSNAGPALGRNSGGVMNIVTKSGNNGFHGDAFWFVRNTDFDANDFFSHSPDELKQNQGGGTIGGPIIKNKLFFFFGYQQTWIRQQSGSGSALSVPAAFRNGDFSSLLSGSNPTVIVDPTTNTPFGNNMIPSGDLSPAALNLLKYAPLPGPNGLVYYSYPTIQDEHQWIARGDYQMNDKNGLFVRLYRNYDQIPAEMVSNNIFSSQQGITGITESATLADTYNPTPTLLTTIQFAATKYSGNRTNAFPTTIKGLGVNLNPSSNEINVSINGASNISLSTNRPAVFARSNFQLSNSWQWVKGKHSLGWGTDIEDTRYNEYNTYHGSGYFEFNGRFSGFDQADYMLGDFSYFEQSNGEIEFKRYHYYGFYGGDTFRVTPRLTITYAVRYEPYFPLYDTKNRIAVFNQGWYDSGYVSPFYVNSPPGLLYPGDKTPSGSVIPKGGIGNQWDNIMPRAGFAWDVFGNGRTSLRAGYGMYYGTPELFQYNNMNDQSPFSFTVDFLSGSFDNPYAGNEQYNVFPFSGDFTRDSLFPIPLTAAALPQQLPRAHTQNWNLTVEHQFGRDWVLRTSYVGSKGTHLLADYDYNAPIYDFNESLSDNQNTIDQRRPLQSYEELDLLFGGLNSTYNSFQVSLNKSFHGGFTNQLSYTLSKALDYVSTNAELTSNTIWDPFNFFAFRGPSDFNRSNRFVDSLVWDVPDAGHALHSGLASAILRDWRTAAIVTLQSGSPFTIFSTNDPVASGGTTTASADVIGPIQLSTSRSRGAQIAEFFNVNSVTQAAPGTFGTLGRNILVGPGYANSDLAVSRNFPLRFLGEAGKLAFRSEFFNLFNRPNLANPGNQIGAADFGQITSTSAPPRILQFSLKILF
jgi:Carboxypeptidase regulatory-like domain